MIIERNVKDKSKKYIIANAEKVRQWLKYLFANHRDYIRMSRNNQLHYSAAAVEALKSQRELAEIVYDNDVEPTEAETRDKAITQAAMESGLSKAEVYTFDKYPNLYLKTQEILKIKKKGLIEVVEDHSVRQPTYGASANLCFPYLYPNGELSPLDFGDHNLAKKLLKKQALFAHRMVTVPTGGNTPRTAST
jgi:hypothetical protein